MTQSAYDFAIDSNHTAYVLQTGAPAITPVSSDGRVGAPLDLADDLSFARFIAVDSDGSLVVAGLAAGTPTQVKIERIAPTGAALGSAQWALSQSKNTELLGLASRSGKIFLAAKDDTEVAIAELSSANEVTALTTLSTAPDSAAFGTSQSDCGRNPGTFSVGPSGQFYLTGTCVVTADGVVTRRWLAVVSADGSSASETIDPFAVSGLRDAFVSSSDSGDVYVATSTATGDGTCDPKSDRSSGNCTRSNLWAADPGTLNGIFDGIGTPEYEVTAVAALDDGAVLFAANSADRFDRYGNEVVQGTTLPGNVTRVRVLPGDSLIALASDDDAKTSSLVRLTYSTLPMNSQAPSAACARDSDCVSKRCCISGEDLSGQCSDGATCIAGYNCKEDSGCAGKLCLKPTGAVSGACSATCNTSKDCPSGTECGYPGCQTAGCPLACLLPCDPKSQNVECSLLPRSFSCQPVVGTDQTEALLCVYGRPAPTP